MLSNRSTKLDGTSNICTVFKSAFTSPRENFARGQHPNVTLILTIFNFTNRSHRKKETRPTRPMNYFQLLIPDSSFGISDLDFKLKFRLVLGQPESISSSMRCIFVFIPLYFRWCTHSLRTLFVFFFRVRRITILLIRIVYFP